MSGMGGGMGGGMAVMGGGMGGMMGAPAGAGGARKIPSHTRPYNTHTLSELTFITRTRRT